MLDDGVVDADGQQVAVVEDKGAGDSLTAGIAARIAPGGDLDQALQLGVAAATLNVTRFGLAGATREEIERLAPHIELRDRERPSRARLGHK